MRKLFAAGLLVVALAVTGCSQPAARLVSTPDVLVTEDERITRTYEASSLLVDSDDTDLVYLSTVEMRTGECAFFTSDDRGESWTRGEAPRLEPFTNCSMGAAQPQNIRTELRQAPDGTIYYLHHANDPDAGGARSVLLGRSSDRGRSWDATAVYEAPEKPADERAEVNFQAHMAIDPEQPQRIYVTWRRSGPEDTRPWMAVSDDGGETFGEPLMMFDRNPGFDAPRPVVVDGLLHVFYRQSSSDDDPKTRLFVATSDDAGESWEHTEITAADDASEPIPLYDEARDVFHLVWHDNRNGDLDVFYSRSRDATTWTRAQRLNDDPVENMIGQYYPQIALGPGGRLDVAWYDYRDDIFPLPVPEEEGEPLGLGSNLGVFQSVYYTRSTDGGDTWSDNVLVSDARIDRTIGTWNGEFFVVVPVSIASFGGEPLISWSDTRNGTAETGSQDIYTSAVTVDVPAVSLAPLAVGLFGGGLLLGAGAAALVGALVLRRRRVSVAPAA